MRQITFTYALLIALLLQAFIPVGYMPQINEDGQFTIEICTSEGIEYVTISGDDDHTGNTNNTDGKQASLHDQCPYAPVNTALHESSQTIQHSASTPDIILPNYTALTARERIQSYASRAPPLLSFI